MVVPPLSQPRVAGWYDRSPVPGDVGPTIFGEHEIDGAARSVHVKRRALGIGTGHFPGEGLGRLRPGNHRDAGDCGAGCGNPAGGGCTAGPSGWATAATAMWSGTTPMRRWPSPVRWGSPCSRRPRPSVGTKEVEHDVARVGRPRLDQRGRRREPTPRSLVHGAFSRIVESTIGRGVELKGWNYVTHTSVRNHAVMEPHARRGVD